MKKSCLFLSFILLVFNFVFVSAQTCQPVAPDLAAWWTGDGNALEVRNRNNGTLENGATYAPGLIGQAFVFDGINDRISLGNPPSLNISSEITVEAWINTNDIPNGSLKNAVARWGFDATQDSYLLGVLKSGGVIRAFGAIGDGVTGDPGLQGGTILPNTWTHLAMTYAGGNHRLYINGTQVASRVRNGGIFTPATNVFIGHEATTNQREFSGLIDEPAIYRRALSAAEIQKIYNAGSAGKCKPMATASPNGLVGFWTGDGTANDFSGNNMHGVLLPGAGFTVGRVGQAFKNGGVSVPDSPLLDFTDAFTLEMWVAPSAAPSNGGEGFFACKGSCQTSQQSYSLQLSADRRLGFVVSNNSTSELLFSNAQIPLNVLTHIVAAYNQGFLSIYINGELDNSTKFPGVTPPLLNSTQPFIIGGGISNTPGIFDEVSLYNRALSLTEILSLYNAGLAGKLKTFHDPSSIHAVGDATVIFPLSTTAGTTQQTPLAPNLFPPLPMGAHTGLFYDIATSATFTGNPTICFNLPAFTAEQFPNLRVMHFENGNWVDVTSSSNTYPTLCTNPVPSFSPFAIANLTPTAANVSISGRVTDFKGNGIGRARLTLTDPSGAARTVSTGSFGYYKFDGVPAGQTYVLSVNHKRYVFELETRILNVVENVSDIDFIASE